jgi:Flp pilus assembly pilin Flp
MNSLMATWVNLANFRRRLSKGQTMAEYAIIVSVVAIAVWVSYQVMGQDLSSMVNNLDTKLSATS